MDTHIQKNLVVNNKEIHYKGIFRVDELFATINRSLENKGYTKREKRNEELVTEEGRQTYLEIRPYKDISNYITLMIKIKINLDSVKEVIDDSKGDKRKYQTGNIQVAFDAWSLTDYDSRWNMKPWTYFIKGFINKFLYRYPFESGARGTLVGDTAYIYAEIRKLLNSYKFETGKVIKEEDIREQMEEEIKKSRSSG